MRNDWWSEYTPFEPITDSRHPRVWLRLLVRGISAWLDKPTKAEAAHKDAWLAEFNAWLARPEGAESSKGPAQPSLHSEPEQLAPEAPERRG